jgi:hypothetical protein
MNGFNGNGVSECEVSEHGTGGISCHVTGFEID